MTIWSAVSSGSPPACAAAEQSHEARSPYPGNKARCLLLQRQLSIMVLTCLSALLHHLHFKIAMTASEAFDVTVWWWF